MSVARREHPSRMLKKASLLTRPTLVATSPARPESAKTASSPRDAPCPKQGHSSADGPRFTFRTSRFTDPGSEARTTLADFFQHPARCRSRFDRSHESIDRLFHDLALIGPHDGP